MLSTIGILAALCLLAFLAMRGVHILLTALICSSIVALTSGLDLYSALLNNYMSGFVGFFKSYFLIFLVGTLFGKFMEDSNAARGIAVWVVQKLGAKRALLAVVLATGIICYGGVSAFVAVFTIFPIAINLFREANLPRRFIGGAIIFGSITFAMTCPGTPQIHNLIPMQYLGTTPMAGAVIGTFTALLMLIVGQLLLEWMVRRDKQRGIGFEPIASDTFSDDASISIPHGLVSLVPLVASLVMLNAFKFSVEVSVLAGIAIGVIVLHKYIDIKTFPQAFGQATSSALTAIGNTCAVVGFGTVVKAAPSFDVMINALAAIPGPPLVGAALGTCLIAGICGSASGGMGIAVPLLAPIYLAQGVDPNALHRVLAIAGGGLDSLPHNGYVVTALNGVCGTSHKDGYAPVFWLTCFWPIICCGIAILLFTLFPSLP